VNLTFVNPVNLIFLYFCSKPTVFPAATFNEGISTGSKLGKPNSLKGLFSCLTATSAAVTRHVLKSLCLLWHRKKLDAENCVAAHAEWKTNRTYGIWRVESMGWSRNEDNLAANSS
jgi:hypothetical protein